MLLNKVTINGILSSENGKGPGTEISLGYRDLGTGEITILSTTDTYETDSKGFTDTAVDSGFTISANNVQVYEGGKQLILIYNGKYQEVKIGEENIVGLTGIVNGRFIYDMVTKNDDINFEASFVKNTKTTIFDDPIINWYIIEDGFENETNVLPLTGKLKEEIDSYYSKKLGIDHGNFSRKIEVEYAYEQGIPIEKLYESLFKNTDIEEILLGTGYSKEQIQKIKKEGMLKNMDVYQQVNKAEWQINVEKRLQEYRNDPKKLDELAGKNEKKQIKGDSIIGNEIEKPVNETITIKINNKKEDEIVNGNPYFSILNIVLFLIIIISGIGLIIHKILKSRKK